MIPVDVQIYTVSERRGHGKRRPYRARWSVASRKFEKTFETKAAAEDFTAGLRRAKREGLPFSQVTGYPEGWMATNQSFFEWVVEWFEGEAASMAFRSQQSLREALVRGVLLAVPKNAPTPPPEMQRYVQSRIGAIGREEPIGVDPTLEAWLRRWSLPLAAFDATETKRLHHGLGLKLDATPLKAEVAKRLRGSVKRCLVAAVNERKIPRLDWPVQPRSKRRSEKVSTAIEPDTIPSPKGMRRIIDGILSHQPSSRGYWILSMISWVVGSRPSETRALMIEDFVLPETGPGRVQIRRALDGDGGFGPTKNGSPRSVEIPEFLVSMIRDYVGARTSGLLVATRHGNPPTISNWNRALKRSCRALGVQPIHTYTFRHSCASMLLNDTPSLSGVAKRLGNTVEVLLNHYIKLMPHDEVVVNSAADRVFSEAMRID